jgi:hypothetical protein
MAYWRHMDPDAFSLKPARGEIESYADAVVFGYRSMDTLMRRFFAWAQADTTIILSSALTPAALLKAREGVDSIFYRLRVPHFLQVLNITPAWSSQ